MCFLKGTYLTFQLATDLYFLRRGLMDSRHKSKWKPGKAEQSDQSDQPSISFCFVYFLLAIKDDMLVQQLQQEERVREN